MTTLITVLIVVVMTLMSVVPLFLVLYLGNGRSRGGMFALAAALTTGAVLGLTLAG